MSATSTSKPIPAPEPASNPRPVAGGRARRIAVGTLLTIATVLAVFAIVATWADRQVLDADNWASTSTRLLQNPTIRTAAANYVVDQLYANVDVAGLVRDGLPPRLQPLAGPITGALRSGAVKATELALSRPAVQDLWRVANRAADQSLINIIHGGREELSVRNGEVSLDLRGIVDQIAQRLGLPSDLGSKLPPRAANLVILRSDQLSLVQSLGRALKGLSILLIVLAVVLYAFAIAIARGRRRRVLMSLGFSGIIAGLVVILFRSIIVRAVANSLVADDSIKPAAKAVVSIATSLLTDVAAATLLIAAVIVVCAWFAGPSRFATPVRRRLAPFLHDEPVVVYLAVAALLLIVYIWQPIHATGTPIGMIVFAVLALLGTEALRRQTAREFPASDPEPSPTVAPPPAAG